MIKIQIPKPVQNLLPFEEVICGFENGHLSLKLFVADLQKINHLFPGSLSHLTTNNKQEAIILLKADEVKPFVQRLKSFLEELNSIQSLIENLNSFLSNIDEKQACTEDNPSFLNPIAGDLQKINHLFPDLFKQLTDGRDEELFLLNMDEAKLFVQKLKFFLEEKNTSVDENINKLIKELNFYLEEIEAFSMVPQKTISSSTLQLMKDNQYSYGKNAVGYVKKTQNFSAELEVAFSIIARAVLGPKRSPDVFNVYDHNHNKIGNISFEVPGFKSAEACYLSQKNTIEETDDEISVLIEEENKNTYEVKTFNDEELSELVDAGIADLLATRYCLADNDLNDSNWGRNEDGEIAGIDLGDAGWMFNCIYKNLEPNQRIIILSIRNADKHIAVAAEDAFPIAKNDLIRFPDFSNRYFLPSRWPDGKRTQIDLRALAKLKKFQEKKWKAFLKIILLDDEFIKNAFRKSCCANKNPIFYADFFIKRFDELKKTLLNIPEFRKYIRQHPEMIHQIADEFNTYNNIVCHDLIKIKRNHAVTIDVKQAYQKYRPIEKAAQKSFIRKHGDKMIAASVLTTALIISGVFSLGVIPLVAGVLAASTVIAAVVVLGSASVFATTASSLIVGAIEKANDKKAAMQREMELKNAEREAVSNRQSLDFQTSNTKMLNRLSADPFGEKEVRSAPVSPIMARATQSREGSVSRLTLSANDASVIEEPLVIKNSSFYPGK